MEGHPVWFLCEARGVPAPDVTWFKDGALVQPSPEAVYTRGGRQLQLGRAQVSDAGIYTCKASNPVGVMEKATRLKVYGEWGYSSEQWSAGRGRGRDSGQDGLRLSPQVSGASGQRLRTMGLKS